MDMRGKNRYRKYIFAVIFLRSKNNKQSKKIKFLVFHRKKNWRGWELLKGGLMDGEDEIGCLKREIREETGSKRFKIIAKTRRSIKYRWIEGYRKDHHLFHGAKGRVFVVEMFGKKIKVDRNEHDRFRWIDSRQMLKYLSHTNLKHAFKYVLKNYKL